MNIIRCNVCLIVSVTLMATALSGCATTQSVTSGPQPTPQPRGAAPDQRNAELPTVAIITTGGTIAMTPDAAAGGAVPTLSGDALVAAVPELAELAALEVHELCNIDSRNMTPELWLQLARLTRDTLADSEVAGVVITHGTDTMEESAYLLDCVLTSDRPVVLTGAQRDATAADADGPRNLLDAVRQVISPQAAGRGVTITLNGRILAARAVTKSHTSNVQAFDAGPFGHVGQIDSEALVWFNRPERASPVPLPAHLPRVELVACYPGADGTLLDAAVSAGAKGIVVAGYGIGNVNEPVFAAIKRARARGVHVVLTTRVPAGRVYAVYGGAGGGASLHELGVILAGNLQPWKARIRLMLVLAQTDDVDELRAHFNE